MNNVRRNKIKKMLNQLRQVENQMFELSEAIGDVYSEDQESLANVPESLQQTAQYETAENRSSVLEASRDTLEEVYDRVTEICESLELVIQK